MLNTFNWRWNWAIGGHHFDYQHMRESIEWGFSSLLQILLIGPSIILCPWGASLPPLPWLWHKTIRQALLLTSQSEQWNWVLHLYISSHWKSKSKTQLVNQHSPCRMIVVPLGHVLYDAFGAPSNRCLYLNSWTSLGCLAITSTVRQPLPAQEFIIRGNVFKSFFFAYSWS